MSIGQIVVLSGICVAFVCFAVVLAWGDYQTRNINHNRAAKPNLSSGPDLQLVKTATAAPSRLPQAARAE